MVDNEFIEKYKEFRNMSQLQKFKYLYPEIWDSLYGYQKLFLLAQFKGYDIKTAVTRRLDNRVWKKLYKDMIKEE